MENVPAPPALQLPLISASAPDSRLPSPPSLKQSRRQSSFSQPVSPRKNGWQLMRKNMKPLSPIGKKCPLSPTRALKKHAYHATFSAYNPREAESSAACPVHSYSTIEQELKAKPSKSVGGVKFGDTERDVLAPARHVCPVHIYAEARSTLSQLGSTSFARYKERDDDADKCPVHAYATPLSSLRQRPATFAKAPTPRVTDMPRCAPDVHAYAEMGSSLSSKFATKFSTNKVGRDGFQQTGRALAPVHSYSQLTSTLRAGGATFGSTPRSSILGSGGLSRTGLLVAPPRAEPTKAPSSWALKPLPKLMPLQEAGAVTACEPLSKAWAGADDGARSPREVEAMLEPRPQSP